MRIINTTFSTIPIGTAFVCGGTRYRKRSSRTAHNLDYGGWFYFGQHERIAAAAISSWEG